MSEQTQAQHHPKTVIALSILLIAVFAAFIPRLTTDTRPNAFLEDDTEVLRYRDTIREQFGLSDPLIIALVASEEPGMFTAENLAALAAMTEAVQQLDNIDPLGVASLATEKRIDASSAGMEVSDFLSPLPQSPEALAELRRAVMDFPLLVGNLISADGSMALIVAEVIDEFQVEATYAAVRKLADEAAGSSGLTIHVAGEGAIAGFLSRYIDADARFLNPLAWSIIMLVMYLSFRRFAPAILVNVVIAASALISLGLMAAMNVPFYMITGALPVILIGISVADTIHIYEHYYNLRRAHPEADREQLIDQTITAMRGPITLTSLTTMAGFFGLYLSAFMPPFRYFGLFAAVGVAAAWAYSLWFLPAAMRLLPDQPPPAQPTAGQRQRSWLTQLGRLTLRYNTAVLAAGAGIGILGLLAATQLTVDEDPITLFHPSEALYRADRAINSNMAGTNALDIVIESPQNEGLLQPHALAQIAALQEYAASLPHVGGSTSYVDYLQQMHRQVQGGDAAQYRIPDTEELAAQLFLLYSAASDPTDFEQQIDYDYRIANVRVFLDTGSYASFRPVVDALQRYVDSNFSAGELRATLSGRVRLNHHWIGELGRSHFAGLGTAVLLVLAVSALLFRSLMAGIYALVPVAGAILLVYAAMVTLDIGLGVGTSMFAAVALGLGVDFATHTLHRMRSLHASLGDNWETIFEHFYATTGRALFFNFLAIACGFGVLISSKVASLNQFGTMILVAICTSFIASMTVLPAMIRRFQPAFITRSQPGSSPAAQPRALWPLLLLLTAGGMGLAGSVDAAEPATGAAPAGLAVTAIVQNVNSVAHRPTLTRDVDMLLIDRRGKQRERQTRVYRKRSDKDTRTLALYTAPANVRGTAFLTLDYSVLGKSDDQWLYLPALRKVRRISAADRGDYFMGTDFTYEDIKLDGELSVEDYDYRIEYRPTTAGNSNYGIEATPRSAELARELGYSRIFFTVDPETWLVTRGEFFDPKGKLLKTLSVIEAAPVDGIWTRLKVQMENHQTGHTSLFTFRNIDYQSPIDDALFTQRALERGVR